MRLQLYRVLGDVGLGFGDLPEQNSSTTGNKRGGMVLISDDQASKARPHTPGRCNVDVLLLSSSSLLFGTPASTLHHALNPCPRCQSSKPKTDCFALPAHNPRPPTPPTSPRKDKLSFRFRAPAGQSPDALRWCYGVPRTAPSPTAPGRVLNNRVKFRRGCILFLG